MDRRDLTVLKLKPEDWFCVSVFTSLCHTTLPFYYRGPKDIDAITHTCNRAVSQATFLIDPQAKHAYRYMIQMRLANFTAAPEFRALELCNLTSEETSTALYSFNTPRFNTNRSFLRLEPNGDLKMYSSSQFNKWDITYLRFGCWRECLSAIL